jgi:hypothetical protein
MLKTISKKYNTLRQAERYQNLLYNKFDNVKLIKSPMFTEYGTYVWAVSGEINPRPKRNPQPKKKNAYSHSKNIVSFYGSEIKGVSFVDRGKGLAVIIHVDDRTKIHLGDNSPRVNGRSVNGNEIVEALIEKYVK